MDLLHYALNTTSTTDKWIIFLHGAGGSIRTWKSQIDSFKDHFNLLAIDLRDHGKSKNIVPAYKSYQFDIVIDDIMKVINKVAIKRAHFVTLSFGSVLVQALYKRHAELVDRMVIIGGVFNANWAVKAFVHSALFTNHFLSYDKMYRVFSFLVMPRKRNQLARRVYQNQSKYLTQEEYIKWLGIYSEFFRLLRDFSNQPIHSKMLILMGEDDYIFLGSARKFAKNRDLATLKVIPKAGHICNIEKPKEVNLEIINFLNS